jgi:hypothetical protein
MVDDFVRRVSEALHRADSLFGSAPAGDRIFPNRLTDAAEVLRRSAAPDMSGSAVAGYHAFAQTRASALARLADVDGVLHRVLRDAASAENTAAAASRSTVAAVAAHADGSTPAGSTPRRQQALVKALHFQVGRQQDLVARHQQRAIELAGLARALSYQ